MRTFTLSGRRTSRSRKARMGAGHVAGLLQRLAQGAGRILVLRRRLQGAPAQSRCFLRQALLDNLDAKMNMALTVARDDESPSNAAEGDFTEKMWALENVRLFRPDPTTLE
mgnify:CR=1 FL=1